MPPTLHPRSALVARDPGISPGGIAGAVIGAVFGGGILLLILGFLYFRHKRLSNEALAREREGISEAKPDTSNRRNSLSSQTFQPAEQATRHQSMKDEELGQPIPGAGDASVTQPFSTYAVGDQQMRGQEIIDPRLPYQPNYTENLQGSSQPQPYPGSPQEALTHTFDGAADSPVAANQSYYDTRISMDSEPEQPSMGPSRQMTEMYEAQRQESREKKGSYSSFRRILDNTFRRKRSTRTSTTTQPTAGTSTPQQFLTSPVDGPSEIKQEPDTETSRGVDFGTYPPPAHFTAEPESYGDSERGQQQRGAAERPPQPAAPGAPHRSAEVRQTTETEPDLPPVDFGSNTASPKIYGAPAAAQPQTRVQERLQSPEIPEPMDIDTISSGPGPSYLRSSHSPALSSETFVSPMEIMNPSTATEMAAYTTYQIENSASPPPTVPHPNVYEDYGRPNIPNAPSPIHDEDVDVDDYLDIPSPDDTRRSGDSFDFSATPGQSSTAPSSGRTPDTRITVSPSPHPALPAMMPSMKQEPESSASPPDGGNNYPNNGVGDVGKLVCHECGREFEQIHKLNHHKRYHDRKHNCPYDGCDKKFGTKTHLDRHINDKHLKTRAYHCTDPSCPWFKGGRAFPRKDNWRRHMIKKHQVPPAQLEGMDESVG